MIFVYEQALLCLGYTPDIWYEAALFTHKAAQTMAEKGDVKTAEALTNDVISESTGGIG